MGDDSQATDLKQRRAACLRLLAHDLNNPLTAIRILAEMLHEELPHEEMRRDMSDVLEAADLASALIEGMSAMVELENPQDDELTWFPMDLGEVIRQAIDRPALRRHVRLELPQELQLGGDRRALGAALTDILVNARRLVDGEHAVVVRARPSELGHRIEVVHPGLGVPGRRRGQLLELFGAVDLREERLPVSAVGLAFAAHVVEGHGGRLTFEDAPEGAMILVLELPRG